MSQDLLSGSLGPDKLTARFQETLSPKALHDLRTPKPSPQSALNPDLIASIEHELREAVVIFEKEKQRLNSEIQRLTSALKTQESQFACDKAELLTKCTAEKRQSEQKIEDLLQRIRDLESEKMNRESGKEQVSSSAESGLFQERLTMSEDMKSAFSKQLSQAQARLRHLEATNSDLTASNLALQDQNRGLTTQLSKAQSQLSASADEHFLLLNNYRKMQQNLHDKVQADNEMREKLTALQNEHEKLLRIRISEKEKISQLESELKFAKEIRSESTLGNTSVSAPGLDLSGTFNLSTFEQQMRDNSRRIQRLEVQLQETSHQYQELKGSFNSEEKGRSPARMKANISSRSLTPVHSRSRGEDHRGRNHAKDAVSRPAKSARPARHVPKLSWKQPH